MFQENIQNNPKDNHKKFTPGILDTFQDPVDAMQTCKFIREEQMLLVADRLSDWDQKAYHVCHITNNFTPSFYYKKRYFSVTGDPFTNTNWKVKVDCSPECEFLPDDWGIKELLEAANKLVHRKRGPRKLPQFD